MGTWFHRVTISFSLSCGTSTAILDVAPVDWTSERAIIWITDMALCVTLLSPVAAVIEAFLRPCDRYFRRHNPESYDFISKIPFHWRLKSKLCDYWLAFLLWTSKFSGSCVLTLQTLLEEDGCWLITEILGDVANTQLAWIAFLWRSIKQLCWPTVSSYWRARQVSFLCLALVVWLCRHLLWLFMTASARSP